MAAEILTLLCTVPDAENAERIATTLVEERLAACCNIVPGIRSVYVWEGKVENGDELLLIIKSTVAVYTRLESRLKELHPYDVPEILANKVWRGLDQYLNWVDQHVEK